MTRSDRTRARLARRQVRARVDAVLGDVEIPDPFAIEDFCRVLGARRGRAILLLPLDKPMRGTVSGMWIAVRDGPDYVLYDHSTAPLHQEHVILHELGHMMLGHRNEGEMDDETGGLLQDLFPNFAPEVLRSLGGSVLGRSGYTTWEEREAEEFAAAVWERAGASRALLPESRAGDGRDRRVLSRLAAVLGPWIRTR